MTDSTELALITSEAPPKPNEYFEHELIHPENVRLESRLAKLRPLPAFKVWRYKSEAARLHRKLSIANFYELFAEQKAIREQIAALHEKHLDIRAQAYFAREQAPDLLPELAEQRTEIMQAAKGLMQQYAAYTMKLSDLYPLAARERQLNAALANHSEKLRTLRIEKQQEQEMEIEAARLAKILRQVWRARKGCYHRWTDGRGRAHYDIPEIELIDIEPTSIWLKVLASKKAMFGYKYALPTGVDLHKLIEEETLQNFSAAIGREVQAVSNHLGTWVVVNRLDSPGGIARHVSYKAAVGNFYPDDDRSKVPYPAGVTEGNRMIWLNFAQWAHVLVGGYTGGGKSNFLNNIIATLISRHSPAEVQLAFIDLKRNEFNLYDNIPHLVAEPAFDIDAANVLLQQMLSVMQDRFALMKALRIKKIDDFNKRAPEGERLPRIVIVLDEAGELLGYGESTKLAHHNLARLTALGRAAGVHVIISTQRPSVKVVPGRIKDNCAVRISFRQPTVEASRTILGVGLAKDIPDIPGRAVMMVSPDPVILQTPHVLDGDVMAAVDTANTYEAAPLELPDGEAYKPRQWTPDDIIEYVDMYLGGRWALYKIWDEIKRDPAIGMTRKELEQVFNAAEKLLQQPYTLGEKVYQLEYGKGKQRFLVSQLVETKDGD